MPTATVLPRTTWEGLATAHAQRADQATAAHRARAGRQQTHAVDDFVYEYYGVRPSRLRRWHPGAGVTLEDAPDHARWRWYTSDAQGTQVDVAAFMAARGDMVRFVETLVSRTAQRPLQLGCFGLHEWAMAYRAGDSLRHDLPLRLGREGTDAVVTAHPLACTHFDAFRFFTPAALPLNRTQLTRTSQLESEQPGCLHATMDLYKWCAKLAPAFPSELQQDCFELAVDVRRVDMRASPYDVSGFCLAAIAVETPEGKREYAQYQREFADRAGELRARILAACAALTQTLEPRR
jgi:hypothetical protein